MAAACQKWLVSTKNFLQSHKSCFKEIIWQRIIKFVHGRKKNSLHFCLLSLKAFYLYIHYQLTIFLIDLLLLLTQCLMSVLFSFLKALIINSVDVSWKEQCFSPLHNNFPSVPPFNSISYVFIILYANFLANPFNSLVQSHVAFFNNLRKLSLSQQRLVLYAQQRQYHLFRLTFTNWHTSVKFCQTTDEMLLFCRNL